MAKQFFVGIDLGGTDIKGGLLDCDGNIVLESKTPTEADQGPEHVLEKMTLLVNEIIGQAPEGEVMSVGVGVPGQVLVENGMLVEAPNLPGVDHFPFGQRMSEAVHLPVFLDNDANMAALGEFAFGAGQGVKHMLMITLGTGVGGGLILDGKVFRGAVGGAGEFGHTVVDADGAPCKCGRTGCVEAYVGTWGLLSGVARHIKNGEKTVLAEIPAESLRPRDISLAAEKGDLVAREVLAEGGHMLGIGIGNVANLLNLERVIVGGGVAGAGERILGPARSALAQTALKVSLDHLEVLPAKLGNSAGMVGAAELARIRL